MTKQTFFNIHNLKTITKNIGHLSILKFMTIILPLATYPYLIRVLGPNIYGTIIFAQSIIVYFSIILNFGFNIYGTKIIAENRDDIKKISDLFSSVTIIKLLLFVLTSIILLLLILIVPKINELWLLFLLSYIFSLEEILFPQWYFLGVDKLNHLTIIGITSKIVFTILVFSFIRTNSDYLLVPIFQGAGVLFSALITGYILKFKEKLKFTIPSFLSLKMIAKESFPLFISSSSKQVYVNANRIIIGSFVGMNEVSYYDLAEKIMNIIKLPVLMMVQAAFPSFTRQKNVKEINKLMVVGVFFTVVLITMTYLFSNDIIELLGSKKMLKSKSILNILVISAFLVSISQFMGTLRMVVFGYIKNFSRIIFNSVIIFGLGFLLLFITSRLNIYSLSWLSVFAEFYVVAQMTVFLIQKRLIK